MPRYTYICPECGTKDRVRRSFDEPTDYNCSQCGAESKMDLSNAGKNTAFNAEVPGVRSDKNRQDGRLLDKIKKLRKEAGYKVEQDARIDMADLYKFRKRRDTIAPMDKLKTPSSKDLESNENECDDRNQ